MSIKTYPIIELKKLRISLKYNALIECVDIKNQLMFKNKISFEKNNGKWMK